MPTYEYECSAGHRYEKREGFEASATQRCAQCRRLARRVLHAPSIVFKGSGFYVTDSRKPALNGAEGPALSGAEGFAAAGESEPKVESTSVGKHGKESKKDGKESKVESPPAGGPTKDAEPAAAG